jgi:hypothetical protein
VKLETIRMVVLVAFELRSYSEAIGRAIQMLRPHLEVAIAEQDELGAKVARLDPELVLCSRPNITGTVTRSLPGSSLALMKGLGRRSMSAGGTRSLNKSSSPICSRSST